MTKKGVFLLVVVFSKESACHLGVLFRFDLCRLGGHTEISPVLLRGVSEIISSLA